MESTPHPKEHNVSYLDDDGTLQISMSRKAATRRLEERVTNRIERGSSLNLPYDFGKSGLIHFYPRNSSSHPQNPTSDHPVILQGHTILPSATIKHLGIYLDNTLSFKAHSAEMASKGLQIIGRLAALR